MILFVSGKETIHRIVSIGLSSLSLLVDGLFGNYFDSKFSDKALQIMSDPKY
jgi:hypothetical protein